MPSFEVPGDNIWDYIFKFRGFTDPSDQNALKKKLWDYPFKVNENGFEERYEAVLG